MKKTLLVLLFPLAPILAATTGLAQGLAASLEAFRVTPATASAPETFVAADAASPGDVIEYRATYTNTTDRALKSVAPEIPVPAGLTWLAGDDAAGSAPAAAGAATKPAPVAASLDGKTFAPLPLLDDTGRPVDPARIRALRWSIPEIGAGETVTLAVRAMVNRPAVLTATSVR
ncbi:hypothetical protein OPIT5_20780 [Opitutaceae bacterium TAV5]|nr:hypothetical protein OPIT5_20780 [Opitutaceae bacterium TAV5]